MSEQLYVIDRHGQLKPVEFDEITKKIAHMCSSSFGPALEGISPAKIAREVIPHLRDNMRTTELDDATVVTCTSRITQNPVYGDLAARIIINNIQKDTTNHYDTAQERLLSVDFKLIIERIADKFPFDFSRDYRFKYFGIDTLRKHYLRTGERPQHFYARIAIGIFMCRRDGKGHAVSDEEFAHNLRAAIEFYEALSTHRVSNATPTMLNSGLQTSQLSSCFQVSTSDDLDSLMSTLGNIAKISKYAGGVSLWLSNMRPMGALINGTGGKSSGIKDYVRIIEKLQDWIDQGGKRPGAFAIYLNVDHADLMVFIEMGRPFALTNAPNLKYALFVSDLFMRKLKCAIADPSYDDTWHLFDPSTAPGLHLVYGDEYEALYERYVREGRSVRSTKVRYIMQEVFKTWSHAGNPYVLFRDHINHKSNMKNVGPINSSNLCCEITIPSIPDREIEQYKKFHPENTAAEYGVCNLASICLYTFITGEVSWEDQPPHTLLDFEAIDAAVRLEVRALNKVIDINFYPSPECERSNQRHRPIGIGMMGLADVLAHHRLPFDSVQAQQLARLVAATIYFAAVSESVELAIANGAYKSFHGSPASEGVLQPDLWVNCGHLETNWAEQLELSSGGRLTTAKWAELRSRVQTHGMRNAYVTAYMPTASSSNIVGQNECFEPFTSNVYVRKTQAGEFTMVNQHLVRELGGDYPLYKNTIIKHGGSIRHIDEISGQIKKIYKTAREIMPTKIVEMAKSMAPFICQSMSMNLYLNKPDLPQILRFLIAGWDAGLKTGMYYCHTAAATVESSSTATKECTSCSA